MSLEPAALVSADARVARIQAQLSLARVHTRGAMSELKGEIARTVDWRTIVRSHPWPAVTAAFVLGLLIARQR